MYIVYISKMCDKLKNEVPRELGTVRFDHFLLVICINNYLAVYILQDPKNITNIC